MAVLEPTTHPTTTQPNPRTRLRGDGRIFKRGQIWWVAFSVDGKEQRESAKTCDAEQAQKYLRKRLKKVHAHEEDPTKPFITQRDRKRTVADLMDALKNDFEIRGKASAQNLSNIARVRADFGSIRATSLAAEDVDQYIEQRLKAGHAKASINRTTQLLKQAYILAELPAPKIRKLDETDNKRRGFFTETEVRNVMSSLSSELSDFTLFAWLTGMRKGEIASLRWEDVDGDELRLRAENSKNGEERVIPFEGELVDLIDRRKKARQFKVEETVMFSAFVFHRKGDPIREFRKSWAKACCLAGVGRLVCPKCSTAVDALHKCEKCGVIWAPEKLIYIGRIFHDLRRSSCRNMLTAGVPQAIAMQISGHRTDSMFRRYAIVAQSDIRKALRMTQEHFATRKEKVVAMGH